MALENEIKAILEKTLKAEHSDVLGQWITVGTDEATKQLLALSESNGKNLTNDDVEEIFFMTVSVQDEAIAGVDEAARQLGAKMG
jgi:hypothetical protein